MKGGEVCVCVGVSKGESLTKSSSNAAGNKNANPSCLSRGKGWWWWWWEVWVGECVCVRWEGGQAGCVCVCGGNVCGCGFGGWRAGNHVIRCQMRLAPGIKGRGCLPPAPPHPQTHHPHPPIHNSSHYEKWERGEGERGGQHQHQQPHVCQNHFPLAN